MTDKLLEAAKEAQNALEIVLKLKRVGGMAYLWRVKDLVAAVVEGSEETLHKVRAAIAAAQAEQSASAPPSMVHETIDFTTGKCTSEPWPPKPASVPTTSVQPAARLLAEQVLSMDMVTPKGTRARELARQVLLSEDRLVTALRLIEHATSDAHDDGAYHEAAHDLAVAALASTPPQGEKGTEE